MDNVKSFFSLLKAQTLLFSLKSPKLHIFVIKSSLELIICKATVECKNEFNDLINKIRSNYAKTKSGLNGEKNDYDNLFASCIEVLKRLSAQNS